MSAVSVVGQIPGLLSTNANVLILSMIAASSKGVRVFATAQVVERFKPLFDELGIAVQLADSVPKEGTYIMIKLRGASITILVYDGGSLVNNATVAIKKFEEALVNAVTRREGKAEKPGVYELVFPENMVKEVSELVFGEGVEDDQL